MQPQQPPYPFSAQQQPRKRPKALKIGLFSCLGCLGLIVLGFVLLIIIGLFLAPSTPEPETTPTQPAPSTSTKEPTPSSSPTPSTTPTQSPSPTKTPTPTPTPSLTPSTAAATSQPARGGSEEEDEGTRRPLVAPNPPNPAPTPPPIEREAPVREAPPAPAPLVQPPPPAPEAPGAAYYPNCDAADAAGASPLYAGSPGYRPGLDRDKDGIACDT